jgi:hypothetical protein
MTVEDNKRRAFRQAFIQLVNRLVQFLACLH